MSVYGAEPVASPNWPKNSVPVILLVEDEAAVREVTRQVLENAGYHVLECTGAVEALRVASENRGRPLVLLSDVVMPGMTGPELAR